MRTYRIHFIRHGLTEANADGRYIGVTDLPLSDSGADELDRIRVKGELPETGLLFLYSDRVCRAKAQNTELPQRFKYGKIQYKLEFLFPCRRDAYVRTNRLSECAGAGQADRSIKQEVLL